MCWLWLCNELRANRDEKAVQAALAEITESVQKWADGGKGENLLALVDTCQHRVLSTFL